MRTLKKTLALVLVLAMVFSLCITASADFTDADEIAYVEAADVMAAIGVIEGMPDGSFDAKSTLTRAQAATIITRLLGAEDYAIATAGEFDDVAADHWAAGAISFCVDAGIVAGYGDGNFGPSDTLTGYQWAKMLLCALGYNAETEGMTGSAWQISVAKLAKANDIFAGNLAADKTAGVTREEAALYAFNLLGAYTVEYKGGSTITVAGITFTQGGTMNQGSKELPTTETFNEKYFPLLKVSSITSDSFGRPAHGWYYGAVESYKNIISIYVDEPVAVYTAATLEKDIYAAFGSAASKSVDIEVYDAVAETTSTFTANKGAVADIFGANGTIVEVYNVGTALVPVYYAVSIPSTFAEVSVATKSATKTAGGYVAYTVGGNTYKAYTSIVNAEKEYDTAVIDGDIANGDMVLYYVVDGTAYISAVDTVKGYVTSKTAAGVVTIGGKQYVAAAAASGLDAIVNTKQEAEFYVDSYGYLLGNVGSTTAADVYVMVLDTNYYQTLVDGKIVGVAAATIVKNDGSVASVEVVDSKLATGKAISKTALEALKGKVVTYVEGANGVVLGTEKAANVTTLDPKNNAIGADILANAKTHFIYANWGYNAAGELVIDGTVSTVTGIANVEKVEAVAAVGIDLSVPADGIADVVYVFENTVPVAAKTDYIYVVSANYTESAEGYTYSVIKGGEETTITVSEPSLEAQVLYASITDNGVKTEAVAAEYGYAKVANNGGLLFADGAFFSGLSCADDVAVYAIDKYDDTCIATTFGELTALQGDIVIVPNAAGTAVAAIYVVYETEA